jgi:hypothetical protein
VAFDASRCRPHAAAPRFLIRNLNDSASAGSARRNSYNGIVTLEDDGVASQPDDWISCSGGVARVDQPLPRRDA